MTMHAMYMITGEADTMAQNVPINSPGDVHVLLQKHYNNIILGT